MMWKSMRKAILAVLISFLLLNSAWALCPFCKNALITSPEGRQWIKGFDEGILLLLAVPFLVAGSIAFLIFRNRRRWMEDQEDPGI